MCHRVGPACGETFTVMTCNIGIEECGSAPPKKMEEIKKWVLDTGRPNILFLQEFMGGVSVKQLAEQLGYIDFVAGRFLKSRTAQVILSDFSLEQADDLDFNPAATGDAAVCAIAKIYGMRVLLVSVHMPSLSPLLHKNKNGAYTISSIAKVTLNEAKTDNKHSKITKILVNWINKKKWDSAIVGGDFNTIVLASSIRFITKTFRDALWPTKYFFYGTKKSKYALPFSPRIDYLFHTENVMVRSAAVLSRQIGDHLPITAEFTQSLK